MHSRVAGVALSILVLAAVLVAGAEEPPSAAARFARAAHFRVTGEAVQTNVGPWSAVTGRFCENSFFNAPYEPVVLRHKLIADTDDPSFVETSTGMKTGLLDGARVRLYRIRDGAFVKLGEAVVPPGGHRAGGWSSCSGGAGFEYIVGGGTRTASLSIPAIYRPGATLWFALRAVRSGRERSELSAPVQVTLPDPLTGEPQANRGAVFNALPREVVRAAPAATPLAPPAGFSAEVRPADRQIAFSWTPVPGAVAYRLYVRDEPPVENERNGLALAPLDGRPVPAVKAGDLAFVSVEKSTWGRRETARAMDWSARAQAPCMFFDNGDAPGRSWQLVPHPGWDAGADRPPEWGRTYLEIRLDREDEVSCRTFAHAAPGNARLPSFVPGRTYVAEAWLRHEGPAPGRVSCAITRVTPSSPIEWAPDRTWKLHRTEFTVPAAAAVGPVGEIVWTIRGPGTYGLDNLRVYDRAAAFMDWMPGDYEELAQASLKYLRTHATTKTAGYGIETLTNPPGVVEYLGGRTVPNECTLPHLLGIMRRASAQPWLQIEMSMSEEDLLGLVEYLAAPYDPAVDRPAAKPWAFKRWRQGQKEPWTDVFDSFLYEVSNETWNDIMPWNFPFGRMVDETTGRNLSNAELYGLFQEYTIAVLKRSPYWPALGAKTEFVIGGHSVSQYGQTAAALSPNSRWVGIASYNGGWDEKESLPEAPVDAAYFTALTFTLNLGNVRSRTWAEEQRKAREAGHDWKLMIYEGGPGYNLNGLNGANVSPKQRMTEDVVMKSQAGGTSTLAAFLDKAQYGFREQAYFDLSRKQDSWGAFAPWTKGGQAWPCFRVVGLFNRHGTGDFLRVDTLSAPTWDLPKSRRRIEYQDAPMVGAWATRRGDRLAVFLLSYKLDHYPVKDQDGFTPVTVDLPIASARKATLHRMAAPPRAHNVDSDEVRIETLPLDPAACAPRLILSTRTGADERGLPPAAVLCYVFEGITIRE